MERLEHDLPQVFSALQHQNYGEYWRSRAIDFERIKCPMYAVSGWADGAYVSAVGEALTELKTPRKGLIGAWGHRFPHLGVPGPAIGFLQESLRWFDQWMRGRETGITREPMLVAWMAQAAPAQNYYAQSPGRWVSEATWPSPRIKQRRLFLNADGRLSERAGKPGRVQGKSEKDEAAHTRQRRGGLRLRSHAAAKGFAAGEKRNLWRQAGCLQRGRANGGLGQFWGVRSF